MIGISSSYVTSGVFSTVVEASRVSRRENPVFADGENIMPLESEYSAFAKPRGDSFP
jgi:hypothetical protein